MYTHSGKCFRLLVLLTCFALCQSEISPTSNDTNKVLSIFTNAPDSGATGHEAEYKGPSQPSKSIIGNAADKNAPIKAIALNEEHTYAGLVSGALLCCPTGQQACVIIVGEFDPVIQWIPSPDCLKAKDSCVEINRMNAPVKSISIAGRFVFAALADGNVWRCIVATENSCIKFFKERDQIHTLIAVTGELLYTVSVSGKVRRCDVILDGRGEYRSHACKCHQFRVWI